MFTPFHKFYLIINISLPSAKVFQYADREKYLFPLKPFFLQIPPLGKIMVPKVGFEPTRPCEHMALNHARLPVPPLRHREYIVLFHVLECNLKVISAPICNFSIYLEDGRKEIFLLQKDSPCKTPLITTRSSNVITLKL